MAWQINGTYVGPCSCRVSCPCELGELVADQGWCSGILALDIRSGSVDGVDVGGTKVVFIGDWPSGFLAGNGTGRLVCDAAMSDAQQSALEGVMSGQKGGVFEVLSSLVPQSLPTLRAPIAFSRNGENVEVSVGDIGVGTYSPLKSQTGETTRLLHGAAAFREDVFLGKGTGSRFSPPDMRSWEGGGHSELA